VDQEQAKFSGWAMIELFGHGHEAGFVTTQYFGDKAMFQVDIPEIPAGQETFIVPRWLGKKLAPVGTVIEKEAIPGRTRLINPGAVYAMNPATEEAVRAVIARNEAREIKVISMPEVAMQRLSAPDNDDGDDHEEELEDAY
jgi:hypothetical protein